MKNRHAPSRIFAGAAIVVALGWDVPARADNLAEAKAHFAIGARAFEQKKFRVAIDAFEESYKLTPRPTLLFSIGQAYKRQYFLDRQAPDLVQAITFLRRYVKDDPKGKRVDEALVALADLEALAQRLGVDFAPAEAPAAAGPPRILVAASAKSATARVDDGAPIDLPNRIETTPGKHVVVIEAQGYLPERREVDLAPGESFPFDVRMQERPALLELEVDESTRVFIDGRMAATTPLVRPLEVPPGRHALGLARGGHDPTSIDLDLRAGEVRPIQAELDPSTQRIGSFVVFGAAIAVAGAGGVFAGLAVGQEQRALEIEGLAAERNISPQQRTEQVEAIDRRDLYRGLAAGGFGGGALLALSGTLMFVIDDEDPVAKPGGPASTTPPPAEDTEMDVALVPAVGKDGVALAAVVRF